MMVFPRRGEAAPMAFREGDRPTNGPGGQWRRLGYFPPAAEPPLHREANQPPPVLLHMRSGPEGGVKGRPP